MNKSESRLGRTGKMFALQDSKLSLLSWNTALEIVNKKLENDPKNIKLLGTKLWVAELLGNKELVKSIKQEIFLIDPENPLIKKKGMCFIATYGTPFTQEVEILKYWRDRYLVKNFFGNLFVKSYYKISPPIADWISKSEKRKSILRFVLDRFIKFLQERI